MFRKTRNRIMLLNMLMVSSVVIVVFAVVFITSYSRVQAETQVKLMYESPAYGQVVVNAGLYMHENFPDDYHADREPWLSLITGEEWEYSEEVITEEFGYNQVIATARRISPDAGMSFSIIVDSDANILEIDSVVDLPPEAFVHVTEIAMNDGQISEFISLEGRTWQFNVSPVRVISTTSGGITIDEIMATTQENPLASPVDHNYIRFVDVTDSQHMLQSLALTLAAATIVVLTVFFFISRYFAKQAVKPMEEAWEKQHRFITDASHELKTPLSVINANCGVLYSNKDEPMEDQIKWVDSISRAANRMAGLVSSLLSLASMEDTQLEPHSSPFDLSGELANAIDEMEAVTQEKELKITREIKPDIVIDSNKEQVHKIISTLLDNAVKYTPVGGEITTTLTKEKRQITCAVRNTGEGIPTEELHNVFDRFYRGDPARSSENNGYGLGLAIAKSIAEQLGAKLTVESAEGEYTEFKLTFEQS